MRFTGKICIVSGGGSGIGKTACKQFAVEGGKVLVVDLDQHGNQTVQEIVQAKGEAIFSKCDVWEPDQVKASIKMALDKWGQIDVVVNAHETTKNVVPYAASKGGIEAFTRGFSEELAGTKIRFNCVAPGAVNTPMLWDNPNVKDGTEKVEGAIGEPEDIAAAICFLAADEARFITGTTLVVDGGRLDILE